MLLRETEGSQGYQENQDPLDQRWGYFCSFQYKDLCIKLALLKWASVVEVS